MALPLIKKALVFAIIFLAINLSPVFASEIEINNADDKWIVDIESLPAGLTDSSNLATKTSRLN